MSKAPELATLAAALKVSKSRVCQLRKKGMPAGTVAEAVAWKEAHVRTTVGSELPAPPQAPAPAPSTPEEMTYSEARRRDAVARALAAERDLDVSLGKLVSVDVVKRGAYLAARSTRDTLMSRMDNLAAELGLSFDATLRVRRAVADAAEEAGHVTGLLFAELRQQLSAPAQEEDPDDRDDRRT